LAEVTHVAVYHHTYAPTVALRHHFLFQAGARTAFGGKQAVNLRQPTGSSLERNVLVKLVRLPAHFRQRLQKLSLNEQGRITLGRVEYSVREPGKVVSVSVQPKISVNERGIAFQGLGGFLEGLAVGHLRRLGIKQAKTSFSPSSSRRKQLERAGLPLRSFVRINKWDKGLHRASFQAVRRAKRKIR